MNIVLDPKDGTTTRLKMFMVNPRLFRWLIGRKVTISGIPADAEYVRSWHDHERDLFCVVFSSLEFDEVIPGNLIPVGTLMTHEELLVV